jgi:O-methyltransferase
LTFQIFQFIIIFIVLIIVARYAWGVIFDKHYQPVEWEHKRKQGMIAPELARLEKQYPDKVRFFNWWFQVERLKKDGIPGDFAELGVYKGESAKILHLMDPSRTFHLYDTFEGFKAEDLEGETGEAATYTTRNFADTSVEAVRRYLGDSDTFVFHIGRFQASSSRFAVPGSQFPVKTETDLSSLRSSGQARYPKPEIDRELRTANRELFALVNLDVDLYAPTKAGLEYFYPRLSPGGVIFIHDYNYKWPGIIKAVDEFVSTVPETLIMVPDMQGTAMIVKS